ncbi:MAG: sulfite exporter TauE/SafE family protein [Acetobacteraceae bacterium]
MLAVARQRRAEYVGELTARVSGRLAHPRVLLVTVAAGIAGAAGVMAYAALLSRAGVPAAAPPLLAVLLASTLSSIAGFAFSAICGAMLLRMMTDPIQIVEVMIVSSIAIQSLSVAVLWRDIDWRGLRSFLAGGVLGLPLGVGLLVHLGHVGFREAIGALLIVYAGYVLLKRPLTIASGGVRADAFVGFLGGITGGLAGFPGASVTMWCGMRGWDKRRQRGTYQPFILIMQIVALVLIQFMHTPTGGQRGLDLTPLQFVPAALLGTWFGLKIFGRMSDRVFAVTVNLLLLVSGIGLLV